MHEVGFELGPGEGTKIMKRPLYLCAISPLIPFEIQTICNPNSFGPFKIQTRSNFRSPLYYNRKYGFLLMNINIGNLHTADMTTVGI